MQMFRRLPIGAAVTIAVISMVSDFSTAFAEDANTTCERQGDRDCICGSREVEEALPRLPAGCHRERITAAGGLSFGILQSADYLARRAWQGQVIDKFGERFQRWEFAACRVVECGPGALSGTTRCTYSGFACSPDVDTRVLDDLKKSSAERSLETDEVRELQRLLKRAGYSIAEDGKFGEATSEALIKWQHRAGVREKGLPTPIVLELLRRREG